MNNKYNPPPSPPNTHTRGVHSLQAPSALVWWVQLNGRQEMGMKGKAPCSSRVTNILCVNIKASLAAQALSKLYLSHQATPQSYIMRPISVPHPQPNGCLWWPVAFVSMLVIWLQSRSIIVWYKVLSFLNQLRTNDKCQKFWQNVKKLNTFINRVCHKLWMLPFYPFSLFTGIL